MPPGDMIPVFGMILSLLLTLIIGGFIVLYPVTRKLGDALEEWVRMRREARPSEHELDELHREIGELAGLVSSLSGDLEDLRDRQRFLEQLREEAPVRRLEGEPKS